MSEFSHAYADGKAEGYQQAITDVLEAARALLREQPECRGQVLLNWLTDKFEEKKDV